MLNILIIRGYSFLCWPNGRGRSTTDMVAISAAREQGDTKMISKYIKVTFGIALPFCYLFIHWRGMPFIFELWLGDHAPTVNSFFVIVFCFTPLFSYSQMRLLLSLTG